MHFTQVTSGVIKHGWKISVTSKFSSLTSWEKNPARHGPNDTRNFVFRFWEVGIVIIHDGWVLSIIDTHIHPNSHYSPITVVLHDMSSSLFPLLDNVTIMGL